MNKTTKSNSGNYYKKVNILLNVNNKEDMEIYDWLVLQVNNRRNKGHKCRSIGRLLRTIIKEDLMK